MNNFFPKSGKNYNLECQRNGLHLALLWKLINWQLRESGSNSLIFKRATLEKQDKELVFTHDERGEVFRVAVNRNQSGKLEYSPIHIGSVEREDLMLWQKADRVLQQIIEEQQQQSIRQSKGFSL